MSCALNSLDLCSLQERLTLKHKNTSKWAKRALRRGINVMDETTKEAMQEQLRLGMQLRQKVRFLWCTYSGCFMCPACYNVWQRGCWKCSACALKSRQTKYQTNN